MRFSSGYSQAGQEFRGRGGGRESGGRGGETSKSEGEIEFNSNFCYFFVTQLCFSCAEPGRDSGCRVGGIQQPAQENQQVIAPRI